MTAATTATASHSGTNAGSELEQRQGFSPKEKLLALLGAVTIVFVVLALLVGSQSRQSVAPQFQQAKLFPGLSENLSEVSAIELARGERSLRVELGEDGQWVLPEWDNFPAAGELVERTVFGLQQTDRLEQKTSRPDWHRFVELNDPGEEGGGSLVRLLNAAGEPLAAALFGADLGLGEVDGQSLRYARREGEDQTWLVATLLDPEFAASEWLDTDFLDISSGRISSVSLTPSEGAPFTILRDENDAFVLAEAPEGRVLSSANALTPIASTLAAVAIDDVRKADQFDFATASQARFETNDGLALDVSVLQQDVEYWMTLAATTTGDGEGVAQEAERINAYAEGWAFELTSWNGSRITNPLEEYLAPVEEAPAQEDTPEEGAGVPAPEAEADPAVAEDASAPETEPATPEESGSILDRQDPGDDRGEIIE